MCSVLHVLHQISFIEMDVCSRSMVAVASLSLAGTTEPSYTLETYQSAWWKANCHLGEKIDTAVI